MIEVFQKVPCVGLEPTTFGLEVQRAIHCASRAWIHALIVLSSNEFQEQVCNTVLVILGVLKISILVRSKIFKFK